MNGDSPLGFLGSLAGIGAGISSSDTDAVAVGSLAQSSDHVWDGQKWVSIYENCYPQQQQQSDAQLAYLQQQQQVQQSQFSNQAGTVLQYPYGASSGSTTAWSQQFSNQTSWHGIQNKPEPAENGTVFTAIRIGAIHMITTPPIKPCPTCGAFNAKHVRTDTFNEDGKTIFVYVYKCRNRGCTTDFVNRNFSRIEDIDIIVREIRERVDAFKLQ